MSIIDIKANVNYNYFECSESKYNFAKKPPVLRPIFQNIKQKTPVFNIIFSKPGVMFDNQKSKIINSIMFNLLLIMFSYAIVAV